jgi:hypothetical protein
VDVTEGGKKLRRGARLWTIAVATFKSETEAAPEVATEMVSEAIEAVAGVIRRTPARRDRHVFRSSEL